MKKYRLVSWAFCSRCHMIQPLIKKFCEENWYEFEEVDVNNAAPALLEWATQLPVIWEDDKQIPFEDMLAKIS